MVPLHTPPFHTTVVVVGLRVAIKLTLGEAQVMVCVEGIVTVGETVFWVIVVFAVAVHPLAAVTVTV